jgi:hypothetical protein
MNHLEEGSLARVVLLDPEMVAIYSLTGDDEVEFRSGDVVLIMKLIYVSGTETPIYARVMREELSFYIDIEFLEPLDLV